MEAAPIRHYRTRIRGASDIAAIADSDVVVIAAGLIRTPGHDRDEHFKENAAIVTELATAIKQHAPNSVVLVATEPVDALVKVALEATGFERTRVLGIGGILDSTRMADFVANAMGISPRDVTAMVIGSHTPQMVPLPEFTRVNGMPIDQLLEAERIAEIVEQTRHAGEHIVELAKRSSAYYAPGAAIAKVVEAICIDTHSVLSLSVMLQGEYGIDGVPVSVPCRVGARGVEQLLEVPLGDDHREALKASAQPVQQTLA